MIGKYKDEASGIPVTEFIGLRSKMYSYLTDTRNVVKQRKV